MKPFRKKATRMKRSVYTPFFLATDKNDMVHRVHMEPQMISVACFTSLATICFFEWVWLILPISLKPSKWSTWAPIGMHILWWRLYKTKAHSSIWFGVIELRLRWINCNVNRILKYYTIFMKYFQSHKNIAFYFFVYFLRAMCRTSATCVRIWWRLLLNF